MHLPLAIIPCRNSTEPPEFRQTNPRRTARLVHRPPLQPTIPPCDNGILDVCCAFQVVPASPAPTVPTATQAAATAQAGAAAYTGGRRLAQATAAANAAAAATVSGARPVAVPSPVPTVVETKPAVPVCTVSGGLACAWLALFCSCEASAKFGEGAYRLWPQPRLPLAFMTMQVTYNTTGLKQTTEGYV